MGPCQCTYLHPSTCIVMMQFTTASMFDFDTGSLRENIEWFKLLPNYGCVRARIVEGHNDLCVRAIDIPYLYAHTRYKQYAAWWLYVNIMSSSSNNKPDSRTHVYRAIYAFIYVCKYDIMDAANDISVEYEWIGFGRRCSIPTAVIYRKHTQTLNWSHWTIFCLCFFFMYFWILDVFSVAEKSRFILICGIKYNWIVLLSTLWSVPSQ